MQLTEETIFIIALILSIIGVFVVIVLGSRIKEQLKVLNAIREDIESSEFYLETLKENTKSKLEELEAAKVELECVKGDIEDQRRDFNDFKSKCKDLKKQFDGLDNIYSVYKQQIDKLGIYLVAAEALAEGTEFDIELFKVHEVPFLDKWLVNIPMRNSIFEALKSVRINKVWELVNTSTRYLLSLPGVGPAAIDEINRILDEHDCYLGMPFINVDGRYYTNKA